MDVVTSAGHLTEVLAKFLRKLFCGSETKLWDSSVGAVDSRGREDSVNQGIVVFVAHFKLDRDKKWYKFTMSMVQRQIQIQPHQKRPN
jgi:hypothetical protein